MYLLSSPPSTLDSTGQCYTITIHLSSNGNETIISVISAESRGNGDVPAKCRAADQESCLFTNNFNNKF